MQYRAVPCSRARTAILSSNNIYLSKALRLLECHTTLDKASRPKLSSGRVSCHDSDVTSSFESTEREHT